MAETKTVSARGLAGLSEDEIEVTSGKRVQLDAKISPKSSSKELNAILGSSVHSASSKAKARALLPGVAANEAVVANLVAAGERTARDAQNFARDAARRDRARKRADAQDRRDKALAKAKRGKGGGGR